MSNVFTCISPIAQIIDICLKYNITDDVINIIITGKTPPRQMWNRWINRTLYEYHFVSWRRDLRLYRNLNEFRTVVLKVQPCAWWYVCKVNRHLKYACCVMLRLLSGCCGLRVYCDTNLPRSDRTCKLCKMNEIEDTEHFIMNCKVFEKEREMLFICLEFNLSQESLNSIRSLSKNILFLILLGMDYPLSAGELFKLRSTAAYYISKMYYRRKHIDAI